MGGYADLLDELEEALRPTGSTGELAAAAAIADAAVLDDLLETAARKELEQGTLRESDEAMDNI